MQWNSILFMGDFKDCSEGQLVDALLKEYEVSEEQAQKGVANTLDILRKNHLLDE